MWERIKRHAGKAILLTALLIYVLYEVSTTLFVYTDDAFVAADVVRAAPQVAGTLQTLKVGRDQAVKTGDVLFIIGQEPFQLQVNRYRAAMASARAEVKAAEDRVKRNKTRTESGAATFDEAQHDYRAAEARLAVAMTDLAQAEWALDQTVVRATADGRVGPVTAQPGDYIGVGQAVLAIVTDDDWRIVANVRERFLASLKVGQAVWFNLASEPWVWRRGTVRSLAAGVARSPDEFEVLPYVNPVTDWIRLPRRFPVEIELDEPQERRRLFQGADASVLVIF
ncbi:MAG: HlyD family secretion protein [Rhodospirillales bacterium]